MTFVADLQAHGLYLRGLTRLTSEQLETYGFSTEQPFLALVGNIGSSYWPVFSRSSEYLDGEADPLDRWSRRVAESIAQERSLRPLFPFDGPPYYPFQRWAQRAEGLEQSPIGVMMHPTYGLWHSYRFALLGAEFDVQQDSISVASACTSCTAKPCLHACPVDAFDATGYDVDSCASYLHDAPQAACRQQGCLARHACPIATEFRYMPAQGKFHLQAFLRSRP